MSVSGIAALYTTKSDFFKFSKSCPITTGILFSLNSSTSSEWLASEPVTIKPY